MLKKLMGAAVLILVGSIVLAGEYTGLITSASKDELMITVGKKTDKVEKKFKVSKDVKVEKRISKKDKEDSTISALAEAITKSKGGKGVIGKIVTDGEGDKETVTKITFGGGKKKPKE